MNRALALDLGDVRIGVAVSDPLGITAQPLPPLQAIGPKKDLGRVEALADEWEARRIVVGLPLSLDGSTGERARMALDFAERLRRRRRDLVVLTWDERLTSVEAERTMRDAGLSSRARRGKVDSVAASILLQSWLDAGSPEAPAA